MLNPNVTGWLQNMTKGLASSEVAHRAVEAELYGWDEFAAKNTENINNDERVALKRDPLYEVGILGEWQESNPGVLIGQVSITQESKLQIKHLGRCLINNMLKEAQVIG